MARTITLDNGQRVEVDNGRTFVLENGKVGRYSLGNEAALSSLFAAARAAGIPFDNSVSWEFIGHAPAHDAYRHTR